MKPEAIVEAAAAGRILNVFVRRLLCAEVPAAKESKQRISKELRLAAAALFTIKGEKDHEQCTCNEDRYRRRQP